MIGGGVVIDGECIVAVGDDATLSPNDRRDARGKYMLLGLTDAQVRMGSEEERLHRGGVAQNMPGGDGRHASRRITTFAHFVGQRNEPLVPNIETIREGNRWSRTDYFFHAIVSTQAHYASTGRTSTSSTSSRRS